MVINVLIKIVIVVIKYMKRKSGLREFLVVNLS